MKKRERLDYISKQIILEGTVSIKELSNRLGVSSMTIRRDLQELAQEGILKLIPGGAVIRRESTPFNEEEYTITKAKSHMIKEKIKICQKAASLIREEDTIIIDTGSTTEHLPRFIPQNMRLTIVCYCLNILLGVYQHNKGSQIIFPGGYFHENSLMFESLEGIELIRRVRANKAFVSAAGVDEKLGITCANFYEVQTKRAIIDYSDTKILLVDSSKFGKVTAAYFADLKEMDIVITDSGIPREYLQALERMNIQYYVV